MNKYLKGFAAAIIVLVFLVLSVYAVSAEQNNNNNNNNYNNSNNNDNNHNNDNNNQDNKDKKCSPTPTPTQAPQRHHYACVENSCTRVNGEGEDTCNTHDENACKKRFIIIPAIQTSNAQGLKEKDKALVKQTKIAIQLLPKRLRQPKRQSQQLHQLKPHPIQVADLQMA